MKESKRSLLLLAYAFPPTPAIAAVRSWCIAKYLSRLGWAVTVMTPDHRASLDANTIDVTEEECRAEGVTRMIVGRGIPFLVNTKAMSRMSRVRRIPVAIFRRLLRPMGIGLDEWWAFPCLRKISAFQKGAFDIILATGSPFSSFVVANRISRHLRIPYVLDYRDLWSLNPMKLYKLASIIRPLESRLIRGAAFTVTVSPSLSRCLASAFNDAAPPKVLTNGFDPEQLDTVTPAEFPHFAVVYTGSFYSGQREIDPVLQAIRMANSGIGSNGSQIRLHYYGADVQYVNDRAKVYNTEDLVVCHGLVSRTEALEAIKGADVAVVIAGIMEQASMAERGIITGKIFEPLGMGVRILLVAPEESDAAIIVEQSKAGRSFCASQVEAMARWLTDLARDKARIHYQPPEAYSWIRLARQLDEMLNKVISGTT